MMKRRRFIKLIGTASVAVVAIPYLPALAGETGVSDRTRPHAPRYRIHGNKRLGCSGFDFPDDPSVLDSGLFMPQI